LNGFKKLEGSPVNSLFENLKNLSPGKIISIAAITFFLMLFFVYFGLKVSSSDMSVLYSNLELEDAKRIVTQLEEKQIKYKLKNNGTQVLIPSDYVNRMRVEMADIAISSGSSNVGYEIFDNSDALGATNFVQNVNLIRALEGELSRTIKSVDNIKTARVHLVLPKREMFSREEQEPSASVVIKTIGGQLGIKEVQSIQKLVAASVPKLETKNVAIVDTSGNLLTNNFQDDEQMAVTNNELLRKDYERKLAIKVQNLLEKVIGAGKVRAQVSVRMNFDKVVTNEEFYDPDGQVVRSTVTVEEAGQSNQNNSSAVSVSQNIPDGMGKAGGKASNKESSRTEETVNYEISKTITNKIRNTGVIDRLSVAVTVDGSYKTNENGNDEYVARTEDEMDQITSLVKSTVGYDADRGDLIEVANMKFVKITAPEIEKPILIMGFTKNEIMEIA